MKISTKNAFIVGFFFYYFATHIQVKRKKTDLLMTGKRFMVKVFFGEIQTDFPKRMD